MREFEVLPHIADIRLKVKAGSVEELFQAAVEGMNSIIRGDRNINEKSTAYEVIIIDSVDTSILLIDLLSEILTLTHSRKNLYYISEINKLTDKHINCSLFGYEIDGFDEDIKAVTYTEANIIRTPNNIFETIIVFDI
ncbi:MAG: archease [Ignavibacteriae bacterium]|nr:MAG: archease [Ignavibacteriota bacterium]